MKRLGYAGKNRSNFINTAKMIFHSRWAVITFSVVFASMMAFLIIAQAYGYKKQQADYYDYKNVQLDQFTSNLKLIFTDIETTAYELRKTSWLRKWTSANFYFDDEFTNLRRIEILEDLKYKISMNALLYDIVLAIPNRRMAICKNGWIDYETYAGAGGVVALDGVLASASNFVFQTTENPAYLMLLYNENYSYAPRNFFICFVIKKDSLKTHIQNINMSQFQSVSLEDGLVAVAEANAPLPAACNLEYQKRQLKYYVSLTVSYSPFWQIWAPNGIKFTVLLSILVLMFSALISSVFNWFFINPLMRLRKLIFKSARPFNDPDLLHRQVESVLDDNQRMHETIELYFETIRNEVLYEMLVDPDFDFGMDLNSYIPFPYANKPYFFMILRTSHSPPFGDLAPPFGLTSPPFVDLAPPCAGFVEIGFHSEERYVIIWFGDTEAAAKYKEYIANTYGDYCTISDVESDITYIHELYLCTLSAHTEKRAALALPQPAPAMPISLEMDVITAFQSNNLEKLAETISLLKNELADPAAKLSLLRLLERYALNLYPDGLDCVMRHAEIISELLNGRPADFDSDYFWADIGKLISHISKSLRQNKIMIETGVSSSVERFVNENFTDASLSLKFLADKFDSDISAMSRLYKNNTGVNFSDYLLSLRIEKAKELLSSSDDSVAAIGQAVGYENYYSFKRAFIRRESVSPKDYRDKLRENNGAIHFLRKSVHLTDVTNCEKF